MALTMAQSDTFELKTSTGIFDPRGAISGKHVTIFGQYLIMFGDNISVYSFYFFHWCARGPTRRPARTPSLASLTPMKKLDNSQKYSQNRPTNWTCMGMYMAYIGYVECGRMPY